MQDLKKFDRSIFPVLSIELANAFAITLLQELDHFGVISSRFSRYSAKLQCEHANAMRLIEKLPNNPCEPPVAHVFEMQPVKPIISRGPIVQFTCPNGNLHGRNRGCQLG